MKYFYFLLLLFASGTEILAQQSGSPDSLYIIQDSVNIPTRSGVDISAMVVRKKSNSTAPMPVVLFYTTYYQGPGDAILAKRSADRDYIGIVAYARGIRTDLTHYSPYDHEGTDVYDILDWISKQPWCNGSIGMLGGSYTGYSQWATMKNPHPALKTIVPQVAVMPGYDMPMENNVQQGNALAWAYDNIYKTEPIRRSLVFEWFEAGTSYRSLDSLVGMENPIFQKWMKHPSYDEYWQSMVPTQEEYERISIPILSTSGYYDGAQIGALKYFKLHLQSNPKAEHYLVLGPYDHWGGQRRPAPNLMGYEIDSVANVSMNELAYQWMDYILKGKAKPALLQNRVNYQAMGTNQWMHASSLDQVNNDTLKLYLDQETLSLEKPTQPNSKVQTVDFFDRENQNNFYTPEIIFDSLDVSGGLVYMTQPVENEFTINGSFLGNLYATINKKDLDISLALYEMTPDGKYFFLTRYLGRASYAKDNSKRQLLQENQKESIPFDNTRFVSKLIGKGSKLVILLNTNKQPFEIINYGSGKEVVDETISDSGEPLRIQWHNDSYLQIPIRRSAPVFGKD